MVAVASAQAQEPDPSAKSQIDLVMAQLYENVSFWSQKGQPEAALRVLERLLAMSAQDPNTLAIAARLAFQIGEFDVGDRYRSRLRELAPNDPRLVPLGNERMLSPENLNDLRQAREFAIAGRKDYAVKAYRRIFADAMPDSLAVEYYTALGTSSPEGFKTASEQLSIVANRWPGDMSFKLALAKLDTYDEGSRVAGIDRLRELSHVSSVAAGARAAWREALLWQGADSQTRDQLNQFLSENPLDSEIAAKLKDVESSLPSAGLVSRMLAYEAVAAGHQQEAEHGFLAALQYDPNDSEAMIMLSIIRRDQRRAGEADKLVARAMELSPERRDEFIKDIGFDPATPTAGYATTGSNRQFAATRSGVAAYGGEATTRAYARVNRLADQGDYAGAEASLRKLMGARPAASGNVQLGYIQLRAGQLAPAESSFRLAMAANPRAAGAISGLATVLERQGRSVEAEALLTQAGNVAGINDIRRARATVLREQAQKIADPASKMALLQDAVAADPSYAWSRLELARALDTQNQHSQARQVMDAAITGAHPSKDQLQASLIYAQERNDLGRASQMIDLVPVKDRTPEMKALQQQAALRAEISGASASGDNAATRARLFQIAARPDPTGVRATEVSKRLLAMHDKASAREAIRLGLANTKPQTSAQRLAYVGPLMEAGYARDANVLANVVDPSGLDTAQRSSLEGVRNDLAIQQSDALNLEGKRAAAYETLAPRLASKPDSTNLNMALSRLYTSAKQPEQALRINEAVLERDPGDLDTRRAAVDSAIQAGDYGHANELIAFAEQRAPDDYRTQLMIADMARARGNTGRALSALRRARELRLQQVNGGIGG